MTAVRESYAVPPLTQVADQAALEAWFVDAAQGDRMLIAAGRVQPKSAMAWMVAQGWEKIGAIAIDCEPNEGGGATGTGGWKWIARRVVRQAAVPDPHAARGASGKSAEPDAPDGTPVTDCILRAIKRAANFGHAAPSLTDLAKLAGLKHAAGAKYYVAKLERRGLIRIDVKHMTGGERRRFQILDTRGHMTSETAWSR